MQEIQRSAKTLDKLASSVVKLCVQRSEKISTAESCTGGLLSQWITSVPGASEVFELGLCSYANRIKQELLEVPEQELRDYGAVSEQVALSMVKGLSKLSGAELCISVTGLAGPGGGTPEMPVGTVYIGFLYKKRAFVKLATISQEEAETRQGVREAAARYAFEIALKLLEGEIDV